MRLISGRALLGMALGVLTVMVVAMWAAPIERAARLGLHIPRTLEPTRLKEYLKNSIVRGVPAATSVPGSAELHLVEGRGLMVETWINDRGPYSFAVDTGAGATILSGRVAQEAGVVLKGERVANVGGITGTAFVSTRQAFPSRLSIGFRENPLPSRGAVVASYELPSDLDGVLDPTEAFWPLGYTIDMPKSEIIAFDPRMTPVRKGSPPPGGAVVAWLPDRDSRRPFVRLNEGDSVLLDTGSAFGLALTEDKARRMGMDLSGGVNNDRFSDVAGGRIASTRIKPSTVQIGTLELRGVPTDVLYGIEAGSPPLLGRDALRPFRVTFDPINKLIQFIPS